MSATCPAFMTGSGLQVDRLLASVDCYTQAGVTTAYSRLFGAHGGFTTVLTAAMTLYLAFYAWQLLTGRAGIGLSALMPRMLLLGAVLTLTTSWPAYQTLVYGLLTDGPDEIATRLLGGSQASLGFAHQLQSVFDRIIDAATTLAKAKAEGLPAMMTAGDLLWASGIMLLMGTLGVLVVAKLMLALLLALGPLFLLCTAFAGTRGLAEGWLRTAVLFALVPLLVTLMGRIALAAFAPIVASLAMGGMAGEAGASSVMLLFAGMLVYLCLLLVALRTAYCLTAGWRLPFGADSNAAAAANNTAQPAQTTSPKAAATVPQTVASATPGIGQLVATIMRTSDRSVASATPDRTTPSARIQAVAVPAAGSRTQPRGQRRTGIGPRSGKARMSRPLHGVLGK
ncbi:MAG: type IV secretion system protein [Alphaproteobacteria bacterium]|nr:MAG: type IV secretion system protein [Alphaproteobacteria bacterium]